MKLFLVLIGFLSILIFSMLYFGSKPAIRRSISSPTIIIPPLSPTPTPSPIYKEPGDTAVIPGKTHVFQTFNNCGPASLSMLLSYFNINISQQELGYKLRPFQNRQGNNDDKSVILPELAQEAQNYNLISYYRPNGSIELIKTFIANDIPVLTRTWLKLNEDIGHYRVIRGYDDKTNEIIQDDSLQGKDLRYSYNEFLKLWQGFNYEYVVVAPPELEKVVQEILGNDLNETTAWKNAYDRSNNNSLNEPQNFYHLFNQSVAAYHIGKYSEAVALFERIEDSLPPRMLWYQIEPIEAYLELGNYNKVFEISEKILNNGNRAFSELYLIRGEIYLNQGDRDLARREFEKAVLYNVNLQKAKDALNSP